MTTTSPSLPSDEDREWLRERRQVVGASDIAGILGISPWATAFSIYLSKVSEEDPAETPPMRWGKLQEQLIAQVYADTEGQSLHYPTKKLLVHPTLPMLGASIDRIRDDGRIVELKTADSRAGWGQSGTDEIPTYYTVQVIQQLFVGGALGLTNPLEADVAVLLAGNDYRCYTVRFQQDVMEGIITAAKDFWENHVLPRVPPPINFAHPANQRILFQLEGFNADVDYRFTEEEDSWLQKFLEYREQESRYEALKLEAKARILAAMGEAAHGHGRFGREAVRRLVRRRGYAVKPTEYVTFDVKE